MLPSTDEEKEGVTAYYLSQSKEGTTVDFLQKVYAETLIGHRHDVWDVHASDGRWWVITNPTNLYSQAQFPNMDLAVTFHMGLCLRIPRTHQQKLSDVRVRPFGEVFVKLQNATDALGQAESVPDYQSVGVRCREILVEFVGAAQDAANWTDQPPKRADFRAWGEIICNTALAGPSQKERRGLLKSMMTEIWTFVGWLTHSKSSTWHDAETAVTTTEHVVGLAASLVVRYSREVPEECPVCGSPHLSPHEGYLQEAPEIAWERPVCAECGWTGKPVPVGERDPGELEELISREGGDGSDECIIPTVPLMNLDRPKKS